jgi:hypothetical protein
MIEQLQDLPPNVVGFVCKGHVTSEDYEVVLVPAVEAAFKGHEKVRLYYQVDTDFSGIESSAMWEDFKVGVEHWLRWERVAVVTDINWIRYSILAFGFLMPGAVKVFPLAEASAAREWIGAAEA